jgi:hypothetical protein
MNLYYGEISKDLKEDSHFSTINGKDLPSVSFIRVC